MNEVEVTALMLTSNSEQEWDKNCDEVKRRCDGYPDFWYATIMMSGLFHEVQAGW